ncbi:MAG: hypothetical protein OEX17_00865 [Rhodospirillaceae bacterium]|nr:hypothetical protein [Rhodospirillaceae bacterium]
MRFATTLSVATTIALLSVSASATDLLSQSENEHALTITTNEGSKTIQIAAKGDIRSICEGCTISLPDGKAEDGTLVEAGKGDIIFLTEKDKLEIYGD